MDPTSIPPPSPISAVFPTPAEPDNNPKHPPYDEMIYTAIGALKEKDGSSKRAIGKYIEQVYKEQLPPTHSALLTHHLNRLKSAGHLLMVKKSYKFPGSDSATLPVSSPPRSRGRPPKPKPTQLLSDSNNSPVVKRTPGRPKKIAPILPAGLSPKVSARRGRPPGSTRSKLPKRAGRPPKPKSVSAISSGLKRRPGRPPKIQSNLTVIPFAAPVASGQPTLPVVVAAAAASSLPNGSPRPRGRPRKSLPTAAPVSGAARGRGRGRGRPRGLLQVVRPGRPQKLAVGRPKKTAGRPVGRPKGSTASAIKAHKAANEDLKKKLEHFQSKVKESLGVLKPYFNHESPVTAIAAIQDLEVLATFDLKAPLRDETQQLPGQQASAQGQTQVYEQNYPEILAEPEPQQFFQAQS